MSAELTGLNSITHAYETLLKERPGVLASESGGELAWLKKARERDAARWRERGLPTRRQERWKYTSLASVETSSVVLPRTEPLQAQRWSYPSLAGDCAAEIVFFNGHFVAEWSKLSSIPGVSVVVLSKLLEECVNEGWTEARREKFAAFRKHLEQSDADRETVFAAMNTSFMQDGVLIHVKPGVVVQAPIVVTNISDSSIRAGASKEMALASPRVFAHLDRGAQGSLLEVYAGGNGHRYITNSVTDVRLESGARLSHAKVQLEGDEGLHIGTTRVRQQRDSFSENFQFSLGGKLSRHDLHVTLEGENAEAVLDGLYMVSGQQHVDNYTLVEHAVPHTTSAQVYKGLLGGNARAVFNGHVRIHRDAQKSNASQLNNNLMLSKKAEVDTKPELEIDADDVKAGHGATIGQIDPEHVFYLEARSIPREEAIRMLARGFAQDVAFRIQDAGLRERLTRVVNEQFEKLSIEALDA